MDIICRVIPALGAGAAYGVAQGTPAQAPIMAVGFAGFSALFYKVDNSSFMLPLIFSWSYHATCALECCSGLHA